MIRHKPIFFNSLLAFVALLFSDSVYAQVASNSCGIIASKAGIVHQISIGEMCLVATDANSNLVVTQGVLQPQEINASACSSCDASQVQVYPNPTTANVTVESFATSAESIRYDVLNAAGAILMSTESKATEGIQRQVISLQAFTPGVYFIQISNANKSTRCTYKISKI
jgi:hypothetical protein